MPRFQVSELIATTRDGVSLHVRRWQPAQRVATVLLTHAMMANHRYFAVLARSLAREGIDVFALDFRGHGRSVPPDPHRDRWCFDEYVRRDLPAVATAIEATAQIRWRDVVYVGHSLGGTSGLAAVGTGTIPAPAAMVLLGTAVWHPGREGSRWRKALMHLYAASAVPLGFAPIRWVGMGTDASARSEPLELCRRLR